MVVAAGISALISLLECRSQLSLWKLTQKVKEVMLCDRIDSFRSVSHSFPEKMAQESVRLIFFERENCGGNCVVWLGDLNAFFSLSTV